MKKMTLGKIFKGVVLFMLVLMMLTGCGKDRMVTVYIKGDIMKVIEEKAEEMRKEGLLDENNNYIAVEVKDDIVGNIPVDSTIPYDIPAPVDTRKFYYNQLNDIEKSMYDILMESRELFIENQEIVLIEYDAENGVNVELSKCARNAMEAYRYDNPLSSIWVSAYSIGMKYNAVYDEYGKYDHFESFSVIVEPYEDGNYADFSTPDETRNAIKLVEDEVAAFVQTLNGSDYEMYTQIHDWIIDGASYDHTVSVPNLRSVYGAIIQKNCVCAGFAYAFEYIVDVAGLDSIFVVGIGDNEPHGWNLVWDENRWNLVDVTWDVEPVIHFAMTDEIEEEYVDEQGRLVVSYKYECVEKNNYSYFMIDPVADEQSGRHLPEKNEFFQYPEY